MCVWSWQYIQIADSCNTICTTYTWCFDLAADTPRRATLFLPHPSTPFFICFLFWMHSALITHHHSRYASIFVSISVVFGRHTHLLPFAQVGVTWRYLPSGLLAVYLKRISIYLGGETLIEFTNNLLIWDDTPIGGMMKKMVDSCLLRWTKRQSHVYVNGQ